MYTESVLGLEHFPRVVMGRKINRNLSETTEPEKLDKFKSVGEKIEDLDPLDCQSRVIEFDKKFDFKEEIVDTIDIIENTSQYIKLFNKNLANRMEKIKEMKFEQPLTIKSESLQHNGLTVDNLYSKPVNELSLIEIKQMYVHWLSIKEKASAQLEELTQRCDDIMEELKKHEMKIDELKTEYAEKKLA